MRYGIYAIRDAKTAFMQCTVDFNDAAAIRNFEHAVQQENSLMATHPGDYDLYKLGEYDNETGELFPATPVQSLVCASALRK